MFVFIERLHSCQVCGTIGEIDQNELKKGGHFYEIATETDQILRDGKSYELPNCLFAKFSKDSDTLILDDEKSHPRVRIVLPTVVQLDNTIIYSVGYVTH